jgi:hypothetical protein
MKTAAVTLLVASTVTALGQGTVQFSNGLFSRLSTTSIPSGGYSVAPVPPTPGLVNYGLFYGLGESTSLSLLSLGVNSTTAAGFIADPSDGKSAITTVPVPGTVTGETDVFVQVLGWSGSFGSDWASAKAAFNAQTPYVFYGASTIVNIGVLGPTAGPGVGIWQSSAGTNPNLIPAFIVAEYVPEPGSLGLACMGAVLLVCRRRGKQGLG